MHKHESRISKVKYLITLCIAIILSLGAGIGTGYLLAEYNASNKNSKPSNIIKKHDDETQNKDNNYSPQPKEDKKDNEQPEQEVNNDTKEEEKDKKEKEDEENTITKQQQFEIVNKVLKKYYNIDNQTYKELLSATQRESKVTGKSKDEIFHKKLIEKYKQVLAKDSLSEMKNFIYNGSLKNYYFSDFFNSKRSTKLVSTDIKGYKDKKIMVETKVTNKFIYYVIPNSDDFFRKLNGKGLTKQQYIKMVISEPDDIKVVEKRLDNFKIEKIQGKWYITSHDSKIISTQIKEVIFEDKTWDFENFLQERL